MKKRTKKTKKTLRNALVVLKGILLVVVVVISLCWFIKPVEKFNTELAGETMRVCYNSVNVRVEPDTNAEVVDEYWLGCRVELSGKTIRYPGHEIYDVWYQTSDGNWIVSDALMPEWDYNQKFGGF